MDTELSDQGQEQAALLARRLSSTPLDAIYSSPLRRALHTAIAIGVAKNLEVQIEPDLTEIDHGAWCGLLKSEVEKRFGPLLQQWLASPSRVQVPGGEALADVQNRARGVVERVLAIHPQGTVALCSHNAVLKVIIATLMGMDLDRFWSLDIDNASLSIIQFGDGRPCLASLNDTCHLGPYQASSTEEAL